MTTRVNNHWGGERVKKLRERLGLTQVEFAAKVGVSFSSVNRWENDQTEPMKLAIAKMEQLERRVLR